MALLHRLRSDESLMRCYQQGDASAFTQLYNRHKDRLYNFLLRACGNAALAEELAQDAWTSLIDRVAHYRPEAKFSTYLFTIARNKLTDYLRRPVNTHTDSLEHLAEDQGLDAVMPGQEQDMLQQVQCKRLLVSIVALPVEQREAFILKEEGFSLQEIASITEVTAETVKSRIRYARQRLRATLSGQDAATTSVRVSE
jgi:RNA polymerase sigma-70 factor (ECF subfamily)